MVNHGISRACGTCKQRHKKCDETRPSCKQCIKARRPCLGYKDPADLIFRRYCVGINGRSSHQSVIAPFRIQVQALPSPPETPPQDFQDAQIEPGALTAFLNDYRVASANRSLSRGFLDGLDCLLDHAGPSSDVALACNIVALACFGKKWERPTIVHKAGILYSGLLQSFRMTVSNATTSNTAESLMTAVLLGLYETLTASATHPGNYGAHSRGVSAILSTENSPFDLVTGAQLFQIANPLLLKGPLKRPQNLGVLCAPASNRPVQSLDAVLIKLRPLLHRAATLLSSPSTLSDDLHRLRQDAMLLNEEYLPWPACQPEEWRPRTIGSIGHKNDALLQGTAYWPGRVDTYFDLYVAAVWNTYRKARLMILDVIIRCSVRLGEEGCRKDEQVDAQELVDGMAASILYHLTDNPQTFMQQAECGSVTVAPGRPIGGLLLMHPLYVMSKLSVVSPQLRAHLKDCLAWIGKHMGIGQATLFSDSKSILPDDSVVEGYILIWAGMLIQPG